MKKKFIMALSAAFVTAALCGTMASCAKTTEGSYSYEAWGTNYGVKVSVKADDEKIKEVKILDSDLVSVSDGWENKKIWNDGINDYLASFVDMPIADIAKVEVATAANGQPSAVVGMNVITGATQGSGRLILAVQEALGIKNATKFGEYHYNAWGSEYGVKVSVAMDGDKIAKVTIIDSDYVEVSDSWENKDIWNNGVANYLKSFEGKTAADLANVAVTTNESGVPSQVSGNMFITGATQGSGRVVLAVQNALGVSNLTKVCTGEYEYEAWGTNYGVKVSVEVKDEVIQKVTILDSDYVEVSEGWKDKQIWLDGVDAYLDTFKGKTVDEVLDVNVTTNDDGVPTEVSDNMFITGATQGSGRVVLAIQDALSK